MELQLEQSPAGIGNGRRVCLEANLSSRKPLSFSEETLGHGLYCVKVARSCSRSRYESSRRQLHDDQSQVWIVLDVPEGGRLPLDELSEPPGKVCALVGPSVSELSTVKRAALDAKELRANGNHVIFRLLVGDIEFPKELRQDIDKLVPHSVRSIIAIAAFDECHFISEKYCENTGDRHVVDRAHRLLDKQHARSNIVAIETNYRESGFGILRSSSRLGRKLYLTADVLLDRKLTADPMIKLERDDKRPSCAVVYAGCLIQLAKLTVEHVRVYCNRLDDNEISRKLVEGAIVAAFELSSSNITFELVILYGDREYDRSVIQFSSMREPGRRPSFGALMREALRVMQVKAVEFMNIATTGESANPESRTERDDLPR